MTDILNPPVVWVNGACYRTNIDPMDVAAATDDRHFDGDAADEFEDEEFYYRDSAGNREDLEDELNLPGTIEQLSNGRFRFSFHVASAFFAMLIGIFFLNQRQTFSLRKFRMKLTFPFFSEKKTTGKKGATKKRLESETRTRITIPKQGTEGELVINGDSKGSLISAYNRISVIIESARARQEFTHFISIPMNAPEMQASQCVSCRNCRAANLSVFRLFF